MSGEARSYESTNGGSILGGLSCALQHRMLGDPWGLAGRDFYLPPLFWNTGLGEKINKLQAVPGGTGFISKVVFSLR